MNYDIIITTNTDELVSIVMADVPGDMIREAFDGVRTAMKVVDPNAWLHDGEGPMQYFVRGEGREMEGLWLMVVFHGTEDYAGGLSDDNWVL